MKNKSILHQEERKRTFPSGEDKSERVQTFSELAAPQH